MKLYIISCWIYNYYKFNLKYILIYDFKSSSGVLKDSSNQSAEMTNWSKNLDINYEFKDKHKKAVEKSFYKKAR